MRAERPRRCHRHLAQHWRTDDTHLPALTDSDRGQPDCGADHSQPDGRAEHRLDHAEPEQFVHLSSGFGGSLVWLWFVLGALVLLGIILLATRTPARSRPPSPAETVETSNWHSRAVDAYAKGAAFDGAVRTAERLDASTEAASIHWADLRRRADDLTEVLYAMRETAPTEHRRDQVENAILSLRAVRDAFEAQRPPGGASSGQGGVLRSQLSALESALNALRVPDDRLI